MPDELDMENLLPRDGHVSASSQHGTHDDRPPPLASGVDAWQPVPAQPPLARKPVGSPPNSSPLHTPSSAGRRMHFGNNPWDGSSPISRGMTSDSSMGGYAGSKPYISESYGSAPPTPGHSQSWNKSLNSPRSFPRRMDTAAEQPSTPSSAGLAPPGYYLPGYQAPGYHPLASPPLPPRANVRPHPAFLLRYWLPHYSMYFFFVAGVLFAVAHHLYYRTLDGQDAVNQIRLLRYGATLSFLCKASLTAAAATAFRQRVWMTVRRKVLTLAAVDSLFAATEDVSALLNLELFHQAKLAILLAVYVWCTPLVVIFASETLVVEPMTVTEETTCPSVRSLNFAHEGPNNWRNPPKINGLVELSLSLWNNTSFDLDDPHFFDYYIAPSQQLEQVATLSAFLKMPIARDNAAAEVCSPGWNCTFTVDFVGPGYKCTELARGVGSKARRLNGVAPPFDTDALAPTTNVTYMTSAFEGEYASEQVPSGPGGVPLQRPPYPRNLGALRTEPVIWVGYAAVDDPSRDQPEERGDPRWATAFTPTIFACEHYETRYEVEFAYRSSVQHTRVKKREHLRRAIDTTFLRGVAAASDGTLDNTTATPQSNYVFPTDDVARYRIVSSYHSLGRQLRHFVNGTITQPGRIANTWVTQTRLTDPHTNLAVPRLERELPAVYEDMILSLLSNPQFLAVVWAADTDRVSGTARGGEETGYPCTRRRTANRYVYRAADLWAAYTVAVVLCGLAVGYGAYAVAGEGVTRSTRFSDIAAATSGPALEKIPWGRDEAGVEAAGTGAGWEAGRVRVGYGVVVSKGSCGFGVEGDVVQAQSGGGPAGGMGRWTWRG